MANITSCKKKIGNTERSVAVLFLFVIFSVASNSNAAYSSPRKQLSQQLTVDNNTICKSMVQMYGYLCQEHTVTTQDGYILSLQRIPASRSGQSATKPPVLLQHGILTDAASWVLNSPDESLGFMLADNGYDVWLANTRGTTQSLNHKWLTSNESAYWEWSWDELAKYDLAAFVQYVHRQTGNKLHYVGHSLGTLMALAAFSKQYHLMNMLRSAALLSPIAHLNHISSLPAKIAAYLLLGEDLYWLGLREFVPGEDQVSKLLGIACEVPNVVCSNLMEVFTGANCCVNSSKAGPFFKHEPEPTSTKNMIHLAQMVRTGMITMYDYGSKVENMNHYSQPTPPVYNMTHIPKDFPLFVGYGGQDMLADVQDVQILLNTLKDHDADKLVVQYVKNFAHVDFVLGVTANQVIYEPIMAFFKLQDS